jgi:Tol biopolymer transport system component
VTAFVLWAAAVLSQDAGPGETFERAYFLEQARGDLEGAVELYESLVENFPDERALAARALLRIGLCHERLGIAAAASAYRRLLQSYGDQEQSARVARERLEALRSRNTGPRLDLPSGATVREILLADGRHVGDDVATISRDGRKLAYVDYELRRMVVYDLIRQTLLLTVPVFVEDGNFVYRWSADGRYLAFDESKGQDRVVEIVDVESGRRNEAFRRAQHFSAAADWTSDSGRLLVLAAGRSTSTLILLDREGRVRKEIETEGGGHRLSPTDDWIAFEAGKEDKEIYVRRLDAGGPSESVPLSPHSSADVNPVWSPDGRYLAFRSNRAKSWDLWVIEIEEGRPAGEPTLLHKDIGEDAHLQEWLPDGRLAFTKTTRLGDIFMQPVDPATGEARGPASLLNTAVRGRNGQPRWSPDGRRMTFRSQREEFSGTLFLADLVAGTETALPTPRGFQNADWYPDGQSLVYCAFTEDGLKLAELDLASRETRFLKPDVRFEAVPAPHVSPDGKRVLFNQFSPATGTSAMYVLDEALGNVDVVPGTEKVFRARWSPDGESIAFERENDICVVRIDGSGERCPVRSEEPERINAWISWSPDGRLLVYPKGILTGNEIDWDLWVASVDGATHHPVGEPKTANPWWVDWSPDGRTLAYASAEGTTGFWMLENFFRLSPPEP